MTFHGRTPVHRHAYPTSWTTGLYRFPSRARLEPGNVPVIGGGTDASVVRAYAHAPSQTQTVEPYANWLRHYQDLIFLRGPLLAVILAAGFGGLLRRGRADVMLPWTVAICLLVVPLVTTDFDYRYVLPAVPFACAAAALTFRSGPAQTSGTAHRRLAQPGTARSSRVTVPSVGTSQLAPDDLRAERCNALATPGAAAAMRLTVAGVWPSSWTVLSVVVESTAPTPERDARAVCRMWSAAYSLGHGVALP